MSSFRDLITDRWAVGLSICTRKGGENLPVGEGEGLVGVYVNSNIIWF